MQKVSLFDRRHLGKKHFFKSQGVTGLYYLIGDPQARPVIILHGLTSNHIGVLPLAAHLSKYRCIVPDMPGHGDAPAPGRDITLKALANWLLEFIKQWPGAIVIAHSYAGSLAMLALRDWPQLVSGCVLMNPVADISNLARGYQRASAVLRPTLGAMINDMAMVRRRRHMYLLERTSDEAREVMNQLAEAEASLKTSKEQMVYFHRLGQLFDDQSIFGGVPRELAKKTYCIVGTRDPLVSPRNNEVLEQVFGKSHVHVCQQSGHLMPVEAFDDNARIVNKLIGKIARPTPFFKRGLAKVP